MKIRTSKKLLFLSGLIFLLNCGILFSAISIEKVPLFFKFNAGARPCGMGGAFCAVADDVNAIMYNPAGIGLIQDDEIMVSYNKFLNGLENNFFGYVQPVDDVFALGFMIAQFNVNIDNNGNTLNGSNTIAFMCTNMSINDFYSIGLNIKIINEKNGLVRSNAYNFDFGILYKTSRYNIGLMIANMNTQMNLKSDIVSLPFNITLGANYKILEKCNIALDINKSSDLRIGCEYILWNYLAIRSGYVFCFDDSIPPDYTLGAGISHFNYRLDYGFLPFKDIGNTHRVSFSLKF